MPQTSKVDVKPATIYPKPDEKQLQQAMSMFYYNQGLPSYYNGFGGTSVSASSLDSASTPEFQDIHQFSESFGFPQAMQAPPSMPTAVTTGLRNPAAANNQTLLNFNELDYFEQFLGNIAPEAVLSAALKPVLGEGGITMNPIMMNTSNGAGVKKHRSRSQQPLQPIQALSQHPIHQHQQRSPTLSSSSSQASAYGMPRTNSRTNKPLLDADTKRAHHIASEHKRRGRIRNELLRLNDLVPELQGNNRNSQSKILSGAADHMEKVIQENGRLKAELAALRAQNCTDKK